MIDFDVEDLKTLRKKYIGARLDIESVNRDYDAIMDLNAGTFELRFSYLDQYEWEEYNYELHAEINKDVAFIKIVAPHCERLVGDDAMRSTYRGKRMDDLDYERIDRKLQELVVKDI